MISRIVGLIALASLSVCVQAGQILDRDALKNVLGGLGALETFEQFGVANSTPAPTNCHTLTDTTICSAQTGPQGPNLVLPGLRFTFGPDNTNLLQWDGPDYLNSPGPPTTKDILSNGSSLDIDFTAAINAFGIDLRTLNFVSNTSAVMDVFGKDDQTFLGTASFGLSTSSVFGGWQDSGGIGRVELRATGQSFSPVIDNLEFGQSSNSNPVPEPSSLLLAGIALVLAARRRARAAHKRT